MTLAVLREQAKTTPGPIGWAGVPHPAAGPAKNGLNI